MKLETIEPHGLCAGVNAAIDKAMMLRDVWCLHALVHNEMVVSGLEDRGFRFVERIEDVPDGETVVFSAHGVPPSVREYAESHRMKVVDATCPFVARAHAAARAFAERGLPVVVLGDPDHVETRGIAGEIAAASPDGVALPLPPPGSRIGVVSQTSMNADEVARQVDELRKTYEVEFASGVCRATKDRQDAVRRFCSSGGEGRRAVLVLGSRTSANARRLAEVAAECGIGAFMAGTLGELESIDFSGIDTLGVTSGASTPESFFTEALDRLRSMA